MSTVEELIRDYAAMALTASKRDDSLLRAALQTIRNGAYERMRSELVRAGYYK